MKIYSYLTTIETIGCESLLDLQSNLRSSSLKTSIGLSQVLPALDSDAEPHKWNINTTHFEQMTQANSYTVEDADQSNSCFEMTTSEPTTMLDVSSICDTVVNLINT